MGLNHGRFQVFVHWQLLNESNIRTIVREMGGKTVA
jgi:hypothetical protein